MSAEPTSSHTGIERCPRCGKTSAWRSDFTYRVGEWSFPGSIGQCRHCLNIGMQQVTRLTATFQEAMEIADPGAHPHSLAAQRPAPADEE